MPSFISRVSITAILFVLSSCGGKDQSSGTPAIDTAANTVEKTNPAIDSSLGSLKPVFEKELTAWAASFKNFNADSFKLSQNSEFPEIDFGQEDDMKRFYRLFGPSLSFSPDSSYFIDLYSAGLMLEEKGKKIIASADVDNAVTLYNLETKAWKRIVSFGPSAWIEEVVWTSPTNFILAGIMSNDEGEQQAFIMQGDVSNKSFRWFDSKAIRSQSVKYEASGMKKLKIDEWE
jgi:WD40 repeat protein